jgi:type VI protein secretion system component VasA
MYARLVADKLKELEIKACPFANLPEKKTYPMGLDEGRNEQLCVAQPRTGRADRVHRVDAGWSLEGIRSLSG